MNHYDDQESKAARLLRLIEDKRIELFTDQYGEAQISFPVAGHYETCAVDHSTFKNWCRKIFWDEEEKTLSNEDINSVAGILSAKANFDNGQHNLFVRITGNASEIHYDLCDPNRHSVKITPDGWTIVKAPLAFRRFPHNAHQYTPIENGNPFKVLEYVNIKDSDSQMLFLTQVISCLIPNIPHWIMCLHGSHSSGKTTTSEIIQRIVDPTKVEGNGSPPTNQNDLVLQLGQNYLSVLDNISSIPQWMSDCLCRAATGGSFSTRKLYTNSEQIIVHLRQCIVLNGIIPAAKMSDLVSRCIVFKHPPLPSDSIRTTEEFRESFNSDLPSILGGMFTTISKAMKLYPTIELEKTYRMADAVKWGCAIAVALDFEQSDYERVLERNRTEQDDLALDNEVVGAAIDCLMREQRYWQGGFTKLHDDLKALYGNSPPSDFPASANKLSERLARVEPNLAARGINIERDRDTQGIRGRFIKITNTSYVPQHSFPDGSTDDQTTQSVDEPTEDIPQMEADNAECVDTDDSFLKIEIPTQESPKEDLPNSVESVDKSEDTQKKPSTESTETPSLPPRKKPPFRLIT